MASGFHLRQKYTVYTHGSVGKKKHNISPETVASGISGLSGPEGVLNPNPENRKMRSDSDAVFDGCSAIITGVRARDVGDLKPQGGVLWRAY